LFIQGRQQRRAGREGREKTIDLASRGDAHETPGPAVLRGTIISARQWRALGRQRGAIVVVVGLVTTARVLRGLRVDEQTILRVIVLAAVTRLAQKKLADLLVRLVAWEHALASSRPLTTGDGNQTRMTSSKAAGTSGCLPLSGR
jgi:hypothetical protein